MIFGNLIIIDQQKRELANQRPIIIRGSQKGYICAFEVTQVFSHNHSDSLPCKYIFETDSLICRYDVAFCMNGSTTKLQIHDQPSNQNHMKVFPNGISEIKLGNLPPGVELTVVTHYALTASSSGINIIEFSFPLQIFDLSGKKENIKEYQFTHDITEYDPIASVTSNIDINYQQTSDRTGTLITNALTDKIDVKIQFVNDLRSIAVRSNNYLAVTLFPNIQPKIQETPEFIFVLDCSGSMSGSRMNRAKECLKVFINSLPLHCHFNIIRFGTQFVSLFDEPQEYNEETRSRAFQVANTMKADLEGTELLEPLQSIFRHQLHDCTTRQVFVLTDGEAENRDNILREVMMAPECRIYTLGIGESADHMLVEGMAKISGGHCDYALGSEDFTSKIIQDLSSSLYERISSTKIEGLELWQVAAYPLPQFIPQQAFTLFLKDANSLKITGKYCNENFEMPIAIVDQFDDISLSELFAYQAIEHLEAALTKRIDTLANKKKLIDISVASGIKSCLTSYSGVVDHIFIPRKRVLSVDLMPEIEQNARKSRLTNENELEEKNSNVQLNKSSRHEQKKDKPFLKKLKGLFTKTKSGDLAENHTNEDDYHSLDVEVDEQQIANEPEVTFSPIHVEREAKPFGEYQLDDLLELQAYTGNWCDMLSILEIAGVQNPEEIPEFYGENKDTIIATVYSLALLYKYEKTRMNSLFFLIHKACNWLNSQNQQVDWKALVMRISDNLPEKRNK